MENKGAKRVTELFDYLNKNKIKHIHLPISEFSNDIHSFIIIPIFYSKNKTKGKENE